jgi:hypothetical protein
MVVPNERDQSIRDHPWEEYGQPIIQDRSAHNDLLPDHSAA